MSDWSAFDDWPMPTKEEWNRLYDAVIAFQKQGARMVSDHHKSYDTTINISVGPWGQHMIKVDAYVFDLGDGGRSHYPSAMRQLSFAELVDWLEAMAVVAREEADQWWEEETRV